MPKMQTPPSETMQIYVPVWDPVFQVDLFQTDKTAIVFSRKSLLHCDVQPLLSAVFRMAKKKWSPVV